MLPAQVALNDPFAVVPVYYVTVHLKSVQLLAAGMMLPELQLPASAVRLFDGAVVLCVNSKQPAEAIDRESASAR